MPVLASTLPLQILLALVQRGPQGASLRELARAVGVRDSTAQHAVGTLVAEGLASSQGAFHERRYRLVQTLQAQQFVRLGLNYLPRRDALGALVRGNDGVEFASYRDGEGELFIVYANDGEAADEVRLRHVVRQIETEPPLRLREARHDAVVEAIVADPSVRERALQGIVLKGRPERSLPDRRRRGDFEHARRLGRPHPRLRLPSRRRIADLARRYGLARIALFGSAVREDFRPDSDVDVVVRYRPDARKRLQDVLGLERELERVFERDVDVVDERSLEGEMRRRAEEEEVDLFPPS